MFTIDLFVALFVFLLFIATFIISKKLGDYSVLLINPIAAVILIFSIFGHVTLHSEVQTEIDYKDKQILLSLSTKSDSYTILSGNSKVGYESKKINASNVTVFLDEDKEPYIEKRIEEKYDMYEKTWLNGGLLNYEEQNGPYSVKETYEIHLPSDSKKIEFKAE